MLIYYIADEHQTCYVQKNSRVLKGRSTSLKFEIQEIGEVLLMSMKSKYD